MGGACNWDTQARPSGAPKQAAEAMPSSQGDARPPIGRARVHRGGGGGGAHPPGRLQHGGAIWGFKGV
jgi:hypothetical protein